jgi:hypothetical protein
MTDAFQGFYFVRQWSSKIVTFKKSRWFARSGGVGLVPEFFHPGRDVRAPAIREKNRGRGRPRSSRKLTLTAPPNY